MHQAGFKLSTQYSSDPKLVRIRMRSLYTYNLNYGQEYYYSISVANKKQ